LTTEIFQTWPDPEASESQFIPRSLDVATIRIVPQFDFSEVRVVRDARTKSVLSGFSSVGGLWTGLAGIFGIFFGSSIMKVLRGVFTMNLLSVDWIFIFAFLRPTGEKTISVMGMAHSFEKKAIRDACLQGYPRLASDLHLAPENRGLLTFMSDHIVDFGFLAGTVGTTPPPPEENRVEEADIEKDPRSQMSVPCADGNRSQNAPMFDPYADSNLNDRVGQSSDPIAGQNWVSDWVAFVFSIFIPVGSCFFG
jgi:hypothetical protein